MQVYFNTSLEIKSGTGIVIPENLVLFQELTDAKEDLSESNIFNYTYRCIIDINIHDPLVEAQTDNVYLPLDNGLYPDHRYMYGSGKERFYKSITNTNDSADIFKTDIVLNQITDFGFDGVWVYENKKRILVVLKEIEALIIDKI